MYKKLSPAAPVTPPYSMYYIFRFWGKLKSLTKWMHFNFFFVQNFFNFFLTFPLQFLTFRLTFWKFGKKNQGFPKIHFHRMLYMRSKADHGEHPQIMRQGVGGRCKLFFAYPVVGGRTKFAVWTHPFIHESSVTNFNIFTLKNVKKC